MNPKDRDGTNPLPTMTPSIDAFLSAAGEGKSADVLAGLFETVIDPRIKLLIRNKLHVTLQHGDERQVNQDALDLLGNIRTFIIAKLTRLRSDPAQPQIDDLEAYVGTVASNSINHHLRQKYPRRLRLKNQLRYLLSHDPRFALWTSEDGEWLCGNTALKEAGSSAAVMSASDLGERCSRLVERRQNSLDSAAISEVVTRIFEIVVVPVRFRDLVTALYELLRISEPVEVSEEEGRYTADSRTKLQERLEQSVFLKKLWVEIGDLPLRHRAALLLNLKNRDGDGLITLLPITGIASIRQIAALLGFPYEEFVRIWHELPWDDNAVAKHLGLTRQQVINLRQSARSTLRRRLNY